MISVELEVVMNTPEVVLKFNCSDKSCEVLHRMSVNSAMALVGGLNAVIKMDTEFRMKQEEKLQRKLPFEEVPDAR